MTDIPDISAEEAANRVESGALLLDVREDEEWAAGHAPGAAHLPLGRLALEIDQVPRDRAIVAVCRVGGRSAKATEALLGAGYDAVNLAGGMQAWDAAGQPVVTDDGTPGQVI